MILNDCKYKQLNYGNAKEIFSIIQDSNENPTCNSLGPSDAIWRQKTGSTLVQVMARQHQAITWTNVDLSSVRSSDILLKAISQQVP